MTEETTTNKKSKKRITWTDGQKRKILRVIIENNHNKMGGRSQSNQYTWSQFDSKIRAELGRKSFNKTQLVGVCNRIIDQLGQPKGSQFQIPKYDPAEASRPCIKRKWRHLKQALRNEETIKNSPLPHDGLGCDVCE